MLKYYCYISKNKIDDLYMQTSLGNIEEKEIQKKIDLDISSGVAKDKFSLLALLGADLSYGANGIIQFNKKEKVQYAKKLNDVIKILEKENLIQDLCLNDSLLQLNSLYYYVNEEFFVTDSAGVINDNGYVDGIVEIGTDTNKKNGVTIKLTCSMKYFSDSRLDGKYMIHSGNYHFFKSKCKIKFETVFILTNFDRENKTIYGSPLFLAINPIKGELI